MNVNDKVKGTRWGDVVIVGSRVEPGHKKRWQIRVLATGKRYWVTDDEL